MCLPLLMMYMIVFVEVKLQVKPRGEPSVGGEGARGPEGGGTLGMRGW